jgi:hypothetical protein
MTGAGATSTPTGVAPQMLDDSARRRAVWVRKPIWLFTAYYLGFLLILWVPLYRYMPQTFVRLTVSPSLFGFTPPSSVVWLYLLGLATIWIGYLLMKPMVHRSTPDRVTGPTSERRIYLWWRRLVIVSAAAYAYQIVLLGKIPLFDISARWAESSKLVAVIGLAIVATCISIAVWGWTRRTTVCFVLTLLALGSLGTRTLPLTLVVAALIVSALYGSKRQFRRGAKIAVVGVILVVLGVGVISKNAIYANSNSTSPVDEAVALLQTDSIGTFYNLTVLHQDVIDGASTHGRMLTETLLNLMPWHSAVNYANFQVGEIIGGRGSVTLGGQIIDRSVSLSATFVGAPFADFGWPNVALLGFIIGAMWSFFEEFAYTRRWFAGLFAYWLAELFAAVYGGCYNDTFILITILCLGSIVASGALTPPDVIRGTEASVKRRSAAGSG